MARSGTRPALPDLGEADALEAGLLRLPDEVWDEMERQHRMASVEDREGPVVTGNSWFDEYERQVWAEARAAEAEEGMRRG
jgi:hypothetical protein